MIPSRWGAPVDTDQEPLVRMREALDQMIAGLAYPPPYSHWSGQSPLASFYALKTGGAWFCAATGMAEKPEAVAASGPHSERTRAAGAAFAILRDNLKQET